MLPETCEELKRDLSDQDVSNPFTQVLEERQRLWLSELKRLYVERLHEVAQKAERSERNLQLQLFMAQQEQRRLRKELRAQQGLAPEPRTSGPQMEADPSARSEEEARWEVGHHCRHRVLSLIALAPYPVASPLQLAPVPHCWALAHSFSLPSGVPEDRRD